jgi:hypothetical protein
MKNYKVSNFGISGVSEFFRYRSPEVLIKFWFSRRFKTSKQSEETVERKSELQLSMQENLDRTNHKELYHRQ